MTTRVEANNYINGRWEVLTNRHEVINPAYLGDVVGTVGLSSTKEAGAAVIAASEALSAWKRLGGVARGNLLYQAAAALELHVDELAQLVATEMGKPVGEARGEAMRAVGILRYYAGEGYRSMGDVIPATNAAVLQYTTREALGPVVLITPWNFPLAIPVWKMAPALIYGNTVVMKPAELSSLSATRMFEILGPLFPPGVVNLVVGWGSDAGEALIQNPLVKGISFTGSSGIGAHIAATAVSHNVKYQTEMGGKNPVIVADDADLDLAAEAIVSGAMRSAGQKCTATSRVVVLQGVHDVLRDHLAARIGRIKQGDPMETDTYLGPVVSKSQFEKVMSLIETGTRDGAELVLGGKLSDPNGYFVAPTLFDQVDPDSTIAQEEIFGPVIGMTPVRTIQEAIDIANHVRYGLSAAVFTESLKTAMTFVESIEAGMVRVNDETAGVELQAPFGGVKASSSHSREQGHAAIDFYTHVKTVAIRP